MYRTIPLISPFRLTAGGNLCQYQYKAPANIEKTPCNHLTNFYGRPSLLSIPSQSYISGVLISPIISNEVWPICADHIQLWAVTVFKLLSQTKVVMMPTNIRPVIIENIVQFTSLWLSKREIMKITGVSQCAACRVIRCVRENSNLTQGLREHLLKTVTSKEDRALLHIMGWKSFLLASRIRVELIRRTV